MALRAHSPPPAPGSNVNIGGLPPDTEEYAAVVPGRALTAVWDDVFDGAPPDHEARIFASGDGGP